MPNLVSRAHPLLLATAAAFAFVTSGRTQEQAGEWWAYRAPQRPEVPSVRDTAWSRNEVDRFVLAGLEAAGLQPAAPAERIALLRRVTYDLTGLPPTLAAVAAFEQDPAPDAYKHVVDGLLASPQYGVKWGRHWLDLVRFAETDSYERDNRKPEAWRYRDWVIDALNRDLPYQDFLREQLAGDERADAGASSLVATGYYRLGIWDDEPTDLMQAQFDDLDGIADTTARVMLGISMGCARCHDHKKDPISNVDYYSFLAFFENLKPYKESSGGGLNPQNYLRTVPAEGAAQQFAAEVAEFERHRQQLIGSITAAATAAYQALTPVARVAVCARMNQGLVASYSCDRSSTEWLHDDGGDHPGRVHGQPVPVAGHRGGALQFAGDDWIELPRLVQDSFTVSFWLASTERGEGRSEEPHWFLGSGLVDGEVDGVVRDWGVSWLADGRVVAGTGAPDTFVASGPGHDDGNWHHVAFTRDRPTGRIALYVDGTLVSEAVGNREPLDAPPRLAFGGQQRGGHGYKGKLDELQFFAAALTSAEVMALALDLRGGVAAPQLLAESPTSTGTLGALHELAGLRRPTLATVNVLCAAERGPQPGKSFVRLRGNARSKGPEVRPALPAVLHEPPPVIKPTADGQSSGRRTALATWITSPANVLTWRVAANRLWQYHFGRGLSRTPNDFGHLGEAPTHPELLDWLAGELQRRGGSLKAMHRLLVTSATYRMGAIADAASLAHDPRNDHFSRFDMRRLTAEEVRDSILAVNGTLNLALGGPSFYSQMPAAVLATSSRPDEVWGKSPPSEAARRSVFIHLKRSLLDPLLTAFDLADTDTSCPVRFSTVQPTQALTLMNGEFLQAQAQLFAVRLQHEAQGPEAQVALGLRLVTCREPRPEEIASGLRLLDDLQRDFGLDAATALQRYCLLLLNLDEFLYLD